MLQVSSQSAIDGGLNRAMLVRSLLLNLIVNALCPYALFRILETHYPPGSVMPLLWSAIFPAAEMIFRLLRSGVLDIVSILALFQILLSLVTTVLAPNVHWALIWGASQDGFIAFIFLLSMFMGVPIIRYLARQFTTANDPKRVAVFEAVVKREGGRVFRIATGVWVVVLAMLCALKLALVMSLLPASYLLYGSTTGTVVVLILIWWTFGYVRPRLRAFSAGDMVG